MDLGQRMTSVKFLIRDRAGQFTRPSKACHRFVEGIRIPASRRRRQSETPAICERIIGSLRRELLDRL